MRSHFLLTGALSVGSLASMGCSISATPDAPDAAEATSSTATAVVVVERTTGPGDAVRADAVIARFVRVHQGTVDDQALRIAGAAWDLPALGTCSASHEQTQATLQPRSVDLLDVGVLTLGERDVPGTAKSTVLLPRTMFDPTGGVSGVFYSARSTEAFTPASRLQLHTSGGPDLPEGFVVNVASPREVADVRVSTDPASGLDVVWDATESDDARDLVYVDVLASAKTGARLIARCTTLDVGHLVVPAASLGPIEEGQLSVHRLHRESFRTKGIEPGEIRFDVARVVTFRR
jgi:hypothetical protein